MIKKERVGKGGTDGRGRCDRTSAHSYSYDQSSPEAPSDGHVKQRVALDDVRCVEPSVLLVLTFDCAIGEIVLGDLVATVDSKETARRSRLGVTVGWKGNEQNRENRGDENELL